jgi:hypothetical protein
MQHLPVFRQFERAWGNLVATSPSRCTLAFVVRWFALLMQQGAVEDFTVEDVTDGFEIGVQDSSSWFFFYVDKP